MIDRPILRLHNPRQASRLKAKPDRRPRPSVAHREVQRERLGWKFDRLDKAFRGKSPEISLRQDPSGIAPERALVFESRLSIHDFHRAAEKIGLPLLLEDSLNGDYKIPAELIDEHDKAAQPTLYATMPSVDQLRTLLGLWKNYQRGQNPPIGLAPWWKLFGHLADIRVWGPMDRLSRQAKDEFLDRLSGENSRTIRLELEIWPTANSDQRARWQDDTCQRINDLGGKVIITSSISHEGFAYEAVLVEISTKIVDEMLADPSAPKGIATIEGIQFVLPQTIAQSLPHHSSVIADGPYRPLEPFDIDAPIRAVLLDGTPMAGHPALDGGVTIEDIHDLVRLSQVENRQHATSMASLILRGDLEADGAPIPNMRLLSIPVLIDDQYGAFAPNDRLFVDMVDGALAQAFLGPDPLAPDAFLVNFSIGVKGSHFAGRISSLARLLDWWSQHKGILFTVSAGNVPTALVIPNTTSVEFEDARVAERLKLVESAQRKSRHLRTLLAPAEAMNVLSVGASSEGCTKSTTPMLAGTVSLVESDEVIPAIYSAMGLGAFRSIKPDFINAGGVDVIRMLPDGNDLRLKALDHAPGVGLNVATFQIGRPSTCLARGTSCANALASRAILKSAAALTDYDGPLDGQYPSTKDMALITKALSINAARWPESAFAKYDAEIVRQGSKKHALAKEEICRHFGHGVLDSSLMLEAPNYGVTLIGTSTIQRDKAAIFQLPLPPSLAGERIGRTMWATVAWFSPVLATRALQAGTVGSSSPRIRQKWESNR